MRDVRVGACLRKQPVAGRFLCVIVLQVQCWHLFIQKYKTGTAMLHV